MPANSNPSRGARQFSGKPVLITGGAGGVGFACAQAFAALGANLLLIGRTESSLQSACKRLEKNYPIEAHSACGDVTDSHFAEHCVQLSHSLFKKPAYALINNAGIIVREPATNTTDDAWQRVMDTNVTGLFYFSRAFARDGEDGGTIVNISSTCGPGRERRSCGLLCEQRGCEPTHTNHGFGADCAPHHRERGSARRH